MFEDEDCPGYWDTLILQNQENYQSITQFNPLKLAILDQKRGKMASNIRNSPFFLMVPVNIYVHGPFWQGYLQNT